MIFFAKTKEECEKRIIQRNLAGEVIVDESKRSLALVAFVLLNAAGWDFPVEANEKMAVSRIPNPAPVDQVLNKS